MEEYIKSILDLNINELRERLISQEKSITKDEAKEVIALYQHSSPKETTPSLKKKCPSTPDISTNKKPRLTDVPITDNTINATVQMSTNEVEASKPSQKSGSNVIGMKKRKEKKKKTLDWNNIHRRRIALQFCYLGERYAGLTIQEDVLTVETELFSALTKTCLIPDYQSCNFTRCGRTDRGVSARMQVVSLDVRSNFPFKNKLDGKNYKDDTSTPVSPSEIVGYIEPYTTTEQSVRNTMIKKGLPIPEIIDADVISRHYVELFQPVRIHSKTETNFAHPQERNAIRDNHWRSANQAVAWSSLGKDDIDYDPNLYTNDHNSNSSDPPKTIPTMSSTAYDEYELDYVSLLNNVLPDDIRVFAWAPVDESFSARFNCDSRVYKYFFYADNMNLEAMNEAARLLKGTHDFRNLCKPDVINLTHFIRRVCDATVQVSPRYDSIDRDTPENQHSVYVKPMCEGELVDYYHDIYKPAKLNEDKVGTSCTRGYEINEDVVIKAHVNNNIYTDSNSVTYPNSSTDLTATPGPVVLPTFDSNTTLTNIETDSNISNTNTTVITSSLSPNRVHPDTLCEFVVVGEAFLYHQVRCMMAILFLVGQGLEKTDIITRLLDIETLPSRPNYAIASEQPLILWDGIFTNLHWRCTAAGIQRAFSTLHNLWRNVQMKAHVLEAFWRTLVPVASQCLHAQTSPDVADNHNRMVNWSQTIDKSVDHVELGHVEGAYGKKGSNHAIDLKHFVYHGDQSHITRNPVIPFLQLAPAITKKNRHSAHPQPLSLVAPTFPPLLVSHAYHSLRSRGYVGFQLTKGRLGKLMPINDSKHIWNTYFPYAECFGHQDVCSRPCENTIDEKMEGLSGKKKDLLIKNHEFTKWVKSKTSNSN